MMYLLAHRFSYVLHTGLVSAMACFSSAVACLKPLREPKLKKGLFEGFQRTAFSRGFSPFKIIGKKKAFWEGFQRTFWGLVYFSFSFSLKSAAAAAAAAAAAGGGAAAAAALPQCQCVCVCVFMRVCVLHMYICYSGLVSARTCFSSGLVSARTCFSSAKLKHAIVLTKPAAAAAANAAAAAKLLINSGN